MRLASSRIMRQAVAKLRRASAFERRGGALRLHQMDCVGYADASEGDAPTAGGWCSCQPRRQYIRAVRR